MSQRKAVTKATATRYRAASRAGKSKVLDELCELTGWHRDHARKALRHALTPKVVRERAPRAPRYGTEVVVALAFCWAVLGAPTGKRLAPIMSELVPRLRRFEELDITDDTAAELLAMSAATMDRRLACDRAKMALRGRSHTKPGSLLKSQIPIRTWAQWDDAAPGFVEIDLVGHEGGNAIGEHAYTLTVTDIATGWTENRSVRNKAEKWVFAALMEIRSVFPFPIIGIDSDNGSEFINWHLLRWCEKEKVTFTRSRAGNSNDGAHVEQKNWAIVRTVVGYHRYDTTGPSCPRCPPPKSPTPTWVGVVVLDVDATLVTAHSEKGQAAPTFKGGFGYHPLAVWCDNTQEMLAVVMRAGNAGSNTVTDHIEVRLRRPHRHALRDHSASGRAPAEHGKRHADDACRCVEGRH